ncbi:MAG: hypothetical protein JZU50_07595 [Desulfobulbaceae bacterium]|nr:hypothetical protein [Desulfobulbaceae bacterium]
MQQVNGSEFKPEEILSLRHYNQKTGQWIESEFPKVGGRLRLAHLQNESFDISTEVFQYDGVVAVVKAVCTTTKGCFCGMGMASVERDAKIAPAILELAETRAIARALRFGGYGVEYCSAEEVSHLEQEGASSPPLRQDSFEPQRERAIYCPSTPGNMRKCHHASILTTQRYIHTLITNNKRAMQALPSLEESTSKVHQPMLAQG